MSTFYACGRPGFCGGGGCCCWTAFIIICPGCPIGKIGGVIIGVMNAPGIIIPMPNGCIIGCGEGSKAGIDGTIDAGARPPGSRGVSAMLAATMLGMPGWDSAFCPTSPMGTLDIGRPAELPRAPSASVVPTPLRPPAVPPSALGTAEPSVAASVAAAALAIEAASIEAEIVPGAAGAAPGDAEAASVAAAVDPSPALTGVAASPTATGVAALLSMGTAAAVPIPVTAAAPPRAAVPTVPTVAVAVAARLRTGADAAVVSTAGEGTPMAMVETAVDEGVFVDPIPAALMAALDSPAMPAA